VRRQSGSMPCAVTFLRRVDVPVLPSGRTVSICWVNGFCADRSLFHCAQVFVARMTTNFALLAAMSQLPNRRLSLAR
jgi:hypothetical protein